MKTRTSHTQTRARLVEKAANSPHFDPQLQDIRAAAAAAAKNPEQVIIRLKHSASLVIASFLTVRLTRPRACTAIKTQKTRSPIIKINFILRRRLSPSPPVQKSSTSRRAVLRRRVFPLFLLLLLHRRWDCDRPQLANARVYIYRALIGRSRGQSWRSVWIISRAQGCASREGVWGIPAASYRWFKVFQSSITPWWLWVCVYVHTRRVCIGFCEERGRIFEAVVDRLKRVFQWIQVGVIKLGCSLLRAF